MHFLDIPLELRFRVWQLLIQDALELVLCPSLLDADNTLTRHGELTCLPPQPQNPLLPLFLISRQCHDEISNFKPIRHTARFCSPVHANEWLYMASAKDRVPFGRIEIRHGPISIDDPHGFVDFITGTDAQRKAREIKAANEQYQRMAAAFYNHVKLIQPLQVADEGDQRVVAVEVGEPKPMHWEVGRDGRVVLNLISAMSLR